MSGAADVVWGLDGVSPLPASASSPSPALSASPPPPGIAEIAPKWEWCAAVRTECLALPAGCIHFSPGVQG
ncbi:MAG: hypothetical protein OD918_08610 [Gammaproteobacteria bacterium]